MAATKGTVGASDEAVALAGLGAAEASLGSPAGADGGVGFSVVLMALPIGGRDHSRYFSVRERRFWRARRKERAVVLRSLQRVEAEAVEREAVLVIEKKSCVRQGEVVAARG